MGFCGAMDGKKILPDFPSKKILLANSKAHRHSRERGNLFAFPGATVVVSWTIRKD